jgi:hypothetical protein
MVSRSDLEKSIESFRALELDAGIGVLVEGTISQSGQLHRLSVRQPLEKSPKRHARMMAVASEDGFCAEPPPEVSNRSGRRGKLGVR